MVAIRWTEGSISDLDKIDYSIAKRIVLKINWLSKNWVSITPERLSNDLSDFYKLRVGDYRLVYKYQKSELIIFAVGHRREIYKK